LQCWIRINDVTQGQDREALDSMIDLKIQLSKFQAKQKVKTATNAKQVASKSSGASSQDLEIKRLQTEHELEVIRAKAEISKLELKLSKAKAKAQQQISHNNFQKKLAEASAQGTIDGYLGKSPKNGH
jgi:hypothetical protein